jgi:hypothetical protein
MTLIGGDRTEIVLVLSQTALQQLQERFGIAVTSYDPGVHLRLRVSLVPLAELQKDLEGVVTHIEKIRVPPFRSLILMATSG